MPKAKFEVLADFDQDGLFANVSSDITTDVLTAKMTRGKILVKQRAEAAVLELVMDNNDHKYSPSKTTSPLYPGNIPSPDVWALVGYPVDDFDASNGTNLASRKPSHDDKFDAWSGDTTDFEVDTNKLKCTSAANNVAVLELNEKDVFLSVRLTRTGSNSGLIMRYSDASNFLIVRSDGTNLIISKVDAGSISSLVTQAIKKHDNTSDSWSSATERRIFAELNGNNIRVWLDSVLHIDTSQSFNNTATKHGIGGRATDLADRWEDFGGWRSIFFGRIDTIDPRPEIDRQYCYIRCFDDMERANHHPVYRTTPTPPADAGEIITEILDAISIDSQAHQSTKANRILDTGDVLTTDTDHVRSMGDDGLTELYQVQDDDVGFIFVDGLRTYRYEDSDHRDTAPYTVARAQWEGIRVVGDETDKFFTHLSWDDGKERVENEGYFKYFRIARVSLAQVWRLEQDDRPAIKNGESLEFLAVGDGDLIASPTTPVATTDYTVNTQENGGGSDLTASVASALTAGFEGNFRLVKLTNNSGSDGFVTFLQLRAIKGTESNPTMARAENTQSQKDVGRRRFQHNAKHIDLWQTAQDRVKKRIEQRKTPKEKLVATMINGTRACLVEILHRSISDRINVVYSDMGISDSYHIERQTITLTEGGLKVECEWELQQAPGGGWGFIRWNQFNWA